MSGLVALVMGFCAIIFAFLGEGGDISKLWGWEAALIVVGGTIAAVLVSFPFKHIKRIGKTMKAAFFTKSGDLVELIAYFKNVSIKTRKFGLLSIEGEIAEDTTLDHFIKSGLQMVVDGVEPKMVREILELDAGKREERNKVGISIFESAGGYAPTMGMIGTVMGLVQVLGSLATSSSDQLGQKIATAFIATLYGVALANLICLPIASRIRNINKLQSNERELIIEAVLLIQEGTNPNTITEKLKNFLDEDELERYNNEGFNPQNLLAQEDRG